MPKYHLIENMVVVENGSVEIIKSGTPIKEAASLQGLMTLEPIEFINALRANLDLIDAVRDAYDNADSMEDFEEQVAIYPYYVTAMSNSLLDKEMHPNVTKRLIQSFHGARKEAPTQIAFEYGENGRDLPNEAMDYQDDYERGVESAQEGEMDKRLAQQELYDFEGPEFHDDGRSEQLDYERSVGGWQDD